MKDYSLNDIQRKKFILNYIIIGKQIIVYYANDDVDTFDYSIEKEKEILERMKYQVISSKSFYKGLNTKFEIFLKLFINEILLFIMFIIGSMSITLTLITNIIGSILLPISILITGYNLNKCNSIRNDFKKHLLFLSNEEYFNNVIRNNLDATKELDEKLRKKVFNDESNNFRFSINTIDNMEYKELREVYRYVDNSVNNKPNTLERKRNRIKR